MNTLQKIRDGALLSDFDDEMRNLVGNVKITGKGGYVTIKIEVKPVPGQVDRVLVKGVVGSKIPQPEAPQDFFYTTDTCNLSTRNPRQKELELKALSPDSDPLISLNNEA